MQASDQQNHLAALKQTLEGAPGDARLLLEIAVLCNQANHHREAASYYARAIQAGANSRAAHLGHATALLHAGDLAAAEEAARKRLKKDPRDTDFNNLLGVILRRQGRYREAIDALTTAGRRSPGQVSPWINLGNVYMDLREEGRAEQMYLKAVKLRPRDSELNRLYGRSLLGQQRFDKAVEILRRAILFNGRNAQAVADLSAALWRLGRYEEAVAEAERGLSLLPDSPLLLLAKGEALRKAGRFEEAAASYESAVRADPKFADAWISLGLMNLSEDREKANGYLRKAVEFSDRSLRSLGLLCDSLNKSRYGSEAEHIQDAYAIACEVLERFPERLVEYASELRNVLRRCANYEAVQRTGSSREVHKFWLQTDNIAAFQPELSGVETLEDRLEIVRCHREWGRKMEARAAHAPLTVPPRAPRDRIRVGFMSSDLRSHPVTYFALPLLEHYDKRRFEVYCYSFFARQEDRVQRHITQSVDHFRWWRQMTDRQIAQGIADDQLDILFELGGTTDQNRLLPLTWRPAPRQGSWLGYPHSTGLESIDYILVDPYLKPRDDRLLIEQPFEMPETWVTLGRSGFHDVPSGPGTPESRNGYLTFGTMNNPYKYNRRLIRAWAGVLQRVPDSRFLFVRPESAVPAFRENMEREFHAHGISADRLKYIPIRGKHLPHYNDMDISLDTFPHVGGTTTCESLWMGVPVISLVGPAFFERMSFSNLSNAGLGDLCADTVDQYIEVAAGLAADRPRREELKATLRSRLRESPLGQTVRFAQNFYRKVEEVLG